jgi:hypothetical protein
MKVKLTFINIVVKINNLTTIMCFCKTMAQCRIMYKFSLFNFLERMDGSYVIY